MPAPKKPAATPLTKYESLSHALWDLQRLLPGISKDGENPHYRSKYTTFDHIKEVVSPILHAAGLLLEQSVTCPDADTIEVSSRIIHVATGDATPACAIRARASANAQETGKTITYYRRYTLVTLLGIRSGEDDDGEASRKGVEEKATAKARMVKAFAALGVTRKALEAYAGPVAKMSDRDVADLGRLYIEMTENGVTWAEITGDDIPGAPAE